jgi:uncharacterized protein
MMYHRYYTEVGPEDLDGLFRTQALGRLVTVAADGTPHLGLFNFVRAGNRVELHLSRKDEQVADLRARGRCAFEVDEPLAVIPSYWVDARDASVATSYYRAAVLECDGEVIDDDVELAAHLQQLLDRYQPEGGYQTLAADEPLYRPTLRALVLVRLSVRAVRPKFKLGQNRPAATRRHVAEELRGRGNRSAATAVEAQLAAEQSQAIVTK